MPINTVLYKGLWVQCNIDAVLLAKSHGFLQVLLLKDSRGHALCWTGVAVMLTVRGSWGKSVQNECDHASAVSLSA
jgi:hypothetical protein